MIRAKTKLKVADNTGARKVECIGIVGASNQKGAKIGDIVKVTVKDAIPNGSIKAGELSIGVIVRSKEGCRDKDGIITIFSDNAVVLLNDSLEMRGTRVFGSISRMLPKKFSKILSLAEDVL